MRSASGSPLQKWARQGVGAVAGRNGVLSLLRAGPADGRPPFPDADRYVLVSNEKAEAPPRLEGNSRKEEYLAAMRKAWRFYGALGFFRTEDLEAMGIGMTGPLMAFSALLGYEIEAIDPIQLDPLGRDLASATSWDSVRFTLRKGGRQVLVDYVRMDLRDGWLKQVARARQWIDDMAWNPVVLKAASHLPQDREFTILRDSILRTRRSSFRTRPGSSMARSPTASRCASMEDSRAPTGPSAATCSARLPRPTAASP